MRAGESAAQSPSGLHRETASVCEAYGVRALVVRADVSDQDGAKKLFDETIAAFGRVDVLVNNAGITRDGLLLRMKPEDFDAVIATNLRGSFLCMKQAARYMLRAKYGRIINMSSVVGLRGNAETDHSQCGRSRND